MTGPTRLFAWGAFSIGSGPLAEHEKKHAIARSRRALTLLRCWPSTVFWRLVPISGRPCLKKAASSLLTRLEPIPQPSVLVRQVLLSTRFP